MGLFDGKVGLVTGAARGQGRNHALRLAREGAAVIAVDVADAVSPDNTYPPATQDDLDETARQLQAGGHRFLTVRADVRDGEGLGQIVAQGVDRFGGRLDIVVANAGICNWGRFWELSETQWSTLIDVNLSGVWRTLKAAAPLMISAGNGGSIITISSVAWHQGAAGSGPLQRRQARHQWPDEQRGARTGRIRDPGELDPPERCRDADGL